MEKLDYYLQDVKTVAISGHINPDGDCIGSSLAVYNYIRENYPDIKVDVYLGEIPNLFKFLSGSDIIQSYPSKDKTHDLFIALDCGDTGRMGNAGKYFESAKKTICIDHHISNEGFGDEYLIVPDASSASELVFTVLDEDRISKEIAECLYVGILHDTGCFQYSSTSSKTMRIAGCLMDKGVDFTRIIDKTFFEKTFEQQKILGLVLGRAQRHLDGNVISCIIDRNDMDSCSVRPRHLEGIVAHMRSTKGVDTAIFIYQNCDDGFKVSLRSQELIDVSKIASEFGGGGHVRAAGCNIKGDPNVALGEILELMQRQL